MLNFIIIAVWAIYAFIVILRIAELIFRNIQTKNEFGDWYQARRFELIGIGILSLVVSTIQGILIYTEIDDGNTMVWVLFVVMGIGGVSLILSSLCPSVLFPWNDDYFIYSNAFGRCTKIYLSEFVGWKNEKGKIYIETVQGRYRLPKRIEKLASLRAALEKSGVKAVKRAPEREEFKNPKGLVIMLAAVAVIAAMFGIAGFFFGNVIEFLNNVYYSPWFLMSTVLLVVAFGGYAFALAAFKITVLSDCDYFIYKNMLGEKRIKFADIETWRVGLKRDKYELRPVVLFVVNGKRYTTHINMAGQDRFAEILEARTKK